MKRTDYELIKRAFVDVRFYCSGPHSQGPDGPDTRAALLALTEWHGRLQQQPGAKGHALLCYCIEALLAAAAEGDREKLYRLADAVHNMPEVCTGDRPLYTFAREGFAPYRAAYKAACINLGRTVTFDAGGGRHGTGTAVDVDEEGRLVVRTAAGETAVFTGEVSVSGVYGAV